MPKVNLPLGSYGIFVPAIDGAWALLTPVDPTILSPGIWVRVVTGEVALNLTKFLQQFARAYSPNAVLGGQFGANVLTGFSIAYTAAAASNVTAALFETSFVNAVAPIVKSAANTPQFVLSPANPIPMPQTAPGTVSVVRVSLADYWLIGQNQEDTLDILDLNFAGTPNLLGVTLHFHGGA